MLEIETRAASLVTAAEMTAINALAHKDLKKDDIAVVDLHVCNSLIDRHFSRFPEKELRAIARMIVGKPLMELHDMNRQPRGTFFEADVEALSAVTSVRASAFVLRIRSNAPFIDNLTGGVFSGTSIAFAFDFPECSACGEDLRGCAHWPGEEYSGEVCHYVMHKVSDVYECSIVPLGSQSTEVLDVRRLETATRGSM